MNYMSKHRTTLSFYNKAVVNQDLGSELGLNLNSGFRLNSIQSKSNNMLKMWVEWTRVELKNSTLEPGLLSYIEKSGVS